MGGSGGRNTMNKGSETAEGEAAGSGKACVGSWMRPSAARGPQRPEEEEEQYTRCGYDMVY